MNPLQYKKELETEVKGKMYRIGICDDEQEYIAAIQAKVLAYVTKGKLSRIEETLQDFEQQKKEGRQVQIADEWIRVADIYYLQARDRLKSTPSSENMCLQFI